MRLCSSESRGVLAQPGSRCEELWPQDFPWAVCLLGRALLEGLGQARRRGGGEVCIAGLLG